MSTLVFSSLRTRLILLVLMAAIPLLLLVIYSGLELRTNAADGARQHAMQLVIREVNEQERLVKETRQLLSVLAEVPLIRNGDIDSCNHFLAKLQNEALVYANIGLIDPDGYVKCSALTMQGQVNASDRSYFKRARESLDFAVGDYQMGRITKEAVLVFAYPVLSERKQLKAMLFASLPLSWIKHQASEFQLLPGSVISVVDHSSHTLLAQYPESMVRAGSSVKNTALIKAIHAAADMGTASITDVDGADRFYAFQQLQGLPAGKEIFISLGIPTTEVYAQANSMMIRNLIVLAVMIALLLLFAWYGSDVMVLQQVTGLLDVTRRLGAGDLHARVDISGSRNEITELGHEFNRMGAALLQRDEEIKKAEILLRNNEDQLRRIVEAVPEIIYTADASDHFNHTFFSPALARILGFTTKEFLHSSDRWLANIHEEDKERVITEMKAALDNAEGYHIEYRMWHKDGDILHWLEDHGRIHRDDDGQSITVYGVMSDITERKQVEKLASRMGHVLEDAWDEIYIIDADSLGITDASHGACRNLGYSMNELRQLTPLDLLVAPVAEQFDAILEPLRRGEQALATFEATALRKDGSQYSTEVRMQFSKAETPPVFIAIVQDISERKQYISELEHQALYDVLTDLPNRSLFQDRLAHALKVAQRHASSLAILMLDVMRLREVNDILGHNAGDQVLQEVARRLQRSLRDSDTVARLGGDEFAIILPSVSKDNISLAANKIQKLFEQQIVIDGISFETEAVIGIALFPEHGEEPNVLMQHADIAMHVAKSEATGFNIYSIEDNPYDLRRLKLLGELRQAIEHKKLCLYYQPQIDLTTGRVVSLEALARWLHPDEGMIPPGDFIPMVEQSGLIKPFTLWVLEEAITQLKCFAETGIDLKIAVNLSTRNLLDSGLLDNIMKLLASYNVSSASLILEVTESAVMSRPDAALKVLTQLHDAGLTLSIDDFGTGYSSLAYLKKLPVSELKIDQAFVSDLNANNDDVIIVRSTIDLAQNMGLKVVAEGVEDQVVMDLLVKLNCDLAQGYHMSPPLPIEKLELWLQDSPWGLEK